MWYIFMVGRGKVGRGGVWSGEVRFGTGFTRFCKSRVPFLRYGEDGTEPGLITALEEFLEKNPHWKSVSYWFNCNGLWILQRNS